VREGNFALDGLLGFDLHGKTVGVVGTGKIGTVFCRIMAGFGCRCWRTTRIRATRCARSGAEYVELDELFGRRGRHRAAPPLTPETHHLIDARRRGGMKRRGDADQHQPRRAGGHAAVIEGSRAGGSGRWGWTSTRRRRTSSSRTSPAR
jgi:D-lactate dehydrogenase